MNSVLRSGPPKAPEVTWFVGNVDVRVQSPVRRQPDHPRAAPEGDPEPALRVDAHAVRDARDVVRERVQRPAVRRGTGLDVVVEHVDASGRRVDVVHPRVVRAPVDPVRDHSPSSTRSTAGPGRPGRACRAPSPRSSIRPRGVPAGRTRRRSCTSPSRGQRHDRSGTGRARGEPRDASGQREDDPDRAGSATPTCAPTFSTRSCPVPWSSQCTFPAAQSTHMSSSVDSSQTGPSASGACASRISSAVAIRVTYQAAERGRGMICSTSTRARSSRPSATRAAGRPDSSRGRARRPGFAPRRGRARRFRRARRRAPGRRCRGTRTSLRRPGRSSSSYSSITDSSTGMLRTSRPPTTESVMSTPSPLRTTRTCGSSGGASRSVGETPSASARSRSVSSRGLPRADSICDSVALATPERAASRPRSARDPDAAAHVAREGSCEVLHRRGVVSSRTCSVFRSE